MLHKLTTAGIVAFWLVMMGWLACREVVPGIRAQRAAVKGTRYNELLSLPRRRGRSRMGIYFAGRRLGHTTTRIRPGAGGTVRILNRTELASEGLPLVLQPFAESTINFEATIGPDERLLTISLEVKLKGSSRPMLDMKGRTLSDRLILHTRVGETTYEKEVKFDPELVLSGGLSPMLQAPELFVGKRWMVRTLNPLTQRMETMWARVVRKEPLEEAGTEEAYVVEIKAHNRTWTSWVDETGVIVKQKTPFGLVFVREPIPTETKPEDDRDRGRNEAVRQ